MLLVIPMMLPITLKTVEAVGVLVSNRSHKFRLHLPRALEQVGAIFMNQLLLKRIFHSRHNSLDNLREFTGITPSGCMLPTVIQTLENIKVKLCPRRPN